MAADDDLESVTMPLFVETAELRKQAVTTGKVRITTHVQERRELIEAALQHTDVIVERMEVGRVVQVAPEVRMDGDVLIYPVVEEVLFVEKRLVLKEELHITRRCSVENVEREVTLRSEQADVERTPV